MFSCDGLTENECVSNHTVDGVLIIQIILTHIVNQ